MIVVDTHVWIWWAAEMPELTPAMLSTIQSNQSSGLMVSAISCWEVAKLVERGRLSLKLDLQKWMSAALTLPGVSWVDLSPEISIVSTTLPGWFHRDPADQIIVATARVLGVPILTADRRILDYPFVSKA